MSSHKFSHVALDRGADDNKEVPMPEDLRAKGNMGNDGVYVRA